MTARRKHSLADVLGPLEAEIMDVVWDQGEVTVREVHRTLAGRRPIAYTTVMTTLGRLADKGLLQRRDDQPAHRYSPRMSKDQYARSTVKSVVDWLVTHFPDPAVSYLIDQVERGDGDVIERLRRAIDERREPRTRD